MNGLEETHRGDVRRFEGNRFMVHRDCYFNLHPDTQKKLCWYYTGSWATGATGAAQRMQVIHTPQTAPFIQATSLLCRYNMAKQLADKYAQLRILLVDLRCHGDSKVRIGMHFSSFIRCHLHGADFVSTGI